MKTTYGIRQLPQLKHATDQLAWGNLTGAALPLALSELIRQQAGLYLLIVPDTPTALRVEQEIAVFTEIGRAHV